MFFECADIEKIEVGMTAGYSQTITDADVKSYAGISGDRNPIHMDECYAEESRFGARIAHGLLSAGFFSAIFGTRIPGPGCVYASQNLEFKRPVYVGDTVKAEVTVLTIDKGSRKVKFRTACYVKKKLVIDGVAELYIPLKKVDIKY